MFPDTFKLSPVENLEKMSAVDSAASAFEEEFNDNDKKKIDKFKNSIEFRDNAYFMERLWHKDKSVPSNYQVALKVLDRTMLSLEKKQKKEEIGQRIHHILSARE